MLKSLRLWLARRLLPRGWMVVNRENFTTVCQWAYDGRAIPVELVERFWPEGAAAYRYPVRAMRSNEQDPRP